MPSSNRVVDRFNQGCSAFRKAIDAWEIGDFNAYEKYLGLCTREIAGAMEWALKEHIQNHRPALEASGHALVPRPTFAQMLDAVQAIASPPLSHELRNDLYVLRDSMRNPSEHHASIPSNEDVRGAIGLVAKLIETYVPDATSRLRVPDKLLLADPATSTLLETYLSSLSTQFEYMDLGGISPRVGSRIVRIPMRDLFVRLRAVDEATLHAEVPSLRSQKVSDEISLGELEPSAPRLNCRSSPIVEPSEIASRHRTVLLGDPGAGKTTVGRFIAHALATRDQKFRDAAPGAVPIVARAADYATRTNNGASASIREYLTTQGSDRFGPLFAWAISSGRAFVVLDGLDEVPDPSSRVHITRRIEQFASEFPDVRIMVLSRLVGYESNRLGAEFDHLVLSELEDDSILQFLRQWHAAIDNETEAQAGGSQTDDQAQQLFSAIVANPGVRKLAGNPLLLTIIALANWRGTKLPNRRVELYEIATETLVENWPLKQRGMTLDADEILGIP